MSYVVVVLLFSLIVGLDWPWALLAVLLTASPAYIHTTDLLIRPVGEHLRPSLTCPPYGRMLYFFSVRSTRTRTASDRL